MNQGLQAAGIIEAPLALVWNELGIVIGMVHYMVPYAVLPILASMREIDPRLLAAARGLGASRRAAFLRVFLPLSLPGLVAAGVLVFIFSLGFYITPAILGGGKTLMAAEWIKRSWSSCSADSGSESGARSNWAKATIEFRGLRSSWLTLARKRLLALLAVRSSRPRWSSSA